MAGDRRALGRTFRGNVSNLLPALNETARTPSETVPIFVDSPLRTPVSSYLGSRPSFSFLPAYAPRFFLAAQYFLILSACASRWAFVRLGRARLAFGWAAEAGAKRAASGFLGALPRLLGIPLP